MSRQIIARIQAQVDGGEVAQAIALAREALAQPQVEDRAELLLALANACLTGGQYLEALRAGVAASDAFKQDDSRGGVCDALTKVGIALRSAGDPASAITTFEQAETLARELGDSQRVAQVLRNVGICSSVIGRHQQALSCLHEADELLRQHGSTTEQLGMRLSLYNARNRQAEAIPLGSPQRTALLEPALADWTALAADCAAAGVVRLEVMALGNHAITAHGCGRHREAIAQLDALLPRYREYGMRPNEGLCYGELGHCHDALGEPAAARAYYLSAIEILRDGGTLDDLQAALEGLSRVEEAMGHHPAALQALKEVRLLDRRKSDEAARNAVTQRELRIELARLTSQWARQATTDPLTGLANRRALEHWMSERLPRVEHGEALTLLLMDLDHFKQVNDRFGHAIGDEVLKRVASVIQHNCRATDLAVRYGGEEFLLALTRVAHDEAVAIADRLRIGVLSQPWPNVARGLAVSVSIGMAEASEAFDAGALLTLADRRLYAAKYGGRNQVVVTG